ncbi:MAG: hypothetical protein WKF43_06965 [Acidimicrobiales bacterium]
MRVVRSGAVVVIVSTVFWASSTAAAQTEADTEGSCRRPAEATVVFVGTVTEIVESTSSFRIRSVKAGEAEVDAIDVDYPTASNLRYIEVGESYQVGANLVEGRYRSVVPTARDACVGEVRTLHDDGSAIDTGTFAEVNERLPSVARTAAIVVVGALVVLIVLGWLFDRPRAYR